MPNNYPTYLSLFQNQITCDTLASSAANQGDNTVSVAQGGTATPGATEQLLPPDRVFKKKTMYTQDQLKADITLDIRSSSFWCSL